MLGFNWIDLIIVLLIAFSVRQGLKYGLSTQLFVLVGFFGGLFLGGWIFPHLLPIQDKTLLTIINGNLVLIFALYLGFKGFDLGKHFRYMLGEGKLYKVESGLGVFVSIAAILIAVWLIGAMIGRLPFEGFSNSVNDALIIQYLDDRMPPVPVLFAVLDKQVNPNASPYIFTKSQPKLSSTYVTPNFILSESHARTSTVRITSFGCGGLVSGSGFVADPGYVVTNAHVIAGVKRPIVKYGNKSYAGKTVLFDPNLDFAVLKVPDLPAAPLTLAKEEVTLNTPVVVVGYPNGNFSLDGGIIRNNIELFGRNIYDLSVISRKIYEVQAKVDNGSSGGPIVLEDGRVAGMLFAKSETVKDYGFALTSPNLIKELQSAEASDRQVNAGVCISE